MRGTAGNKKTAIRGSPFSLWRLLDQLQVILPVFNVC